MLRGPLQEGSLFAKDYRVVRLLREGGMGAVYVAQQVSTGKERALKVMRRELVANEGLRRRFEQEARVGAKIESEHVVDVQSAGIDEATGTPYLVMELLRGKDLAQVMAERGAFSPADTTALLEELCDAVGAAHEVGIVHRDLKPENVFLAETKRGKTSTSKVKVLDFGIAKLAAEAATHATAPLGSPIWMAHEQTEFGNVTAPLVAAPTTPDGAPDGSGEGPREHGVRAGRVRRPCSGSRRASEGRDSNRDSNRNRSHTHP